MAELGTGYISIVPEVSKISPGIAKALKGVDSEAAKAGESMGSKLSDKLQGTLKTGAIGAGVAAGGFLAAGLTKGIGRLNSIEQAEAKLAGLGNSTQKVGAIMENALASVNGTAFGLEEAAASAAGLVAAGVKPGKELETTLTTVADTATIAGASMQEVGTIFGSVAARGKLQGDDMLQLLSRGVPVLQLLAEETGKTSAEISDMVSRGEVDFATFERAMRRGMGGAAQEAGETAQGAFRNMWAAAGRLGATLAGPFFEQSAGAFKGVTSALDNMTTAAKPLMEQFSAWLSGTAIPAFKRFGESAKGAFDEFRNSSAVQAALGTTVEAFKNLVGAGKAVGPALGSIASSLAEASAALGVSGWQLFATALNVAAGAVNALSGPLNAVAGVLERHPGLVATAVAAWVGFKTIPGIIGPLSEKLGSATDSVKRFGDQMKVQQALAAKSGVEVGRFGSAIATLEARVPVIHRANEAFRQGYGPLRMLGDQTKQTASQFSGFTRYAVTAHGTLQTFAGVATGAARGGMSLLKSGITGVTNALGGPWALALAGGVAAVTAVSQQVQRWNSYQDASKKLAETSTSAYQGMFNAIAQGSDQVGAMSSQIEKMQSSLGEVANSGPAWYERWYINLNSATHGFATAQVKAADAANNAWRDSTDAAKRAQEGLKELGMTNEELSQKVMGSTTQWNAFKAELEAGGENQAAAAAQLQQLRDGYEKSAAAAERMGPAVSNAAATIQELSKKTGDAASRADKLRVAFMELRGVNMSADEAAANLTQQLANVTAGMEDVAGATLKANGTIDTTTESGAALFNSLNDIGSAMQRSVAAGNDAAGVFQQSSAQLEQLRVAAGLGKDEWNALLEKMGMTPEKMSIVADVESDTAKAEIAAVAEQLSQFEGAGPHKATITVTDEEAKSKLEAAGFMIDKWDEKTGVADITMSDQSALDRLNWWISAGFPQIDLANPTAKANLDDSGMLFKLDYAKMQLDTLDLKRPTPLADMDTSMLSQKQVDALNKVGLLDGRRPTPAADMDISKLTKEQQIALAQVFDLAAKRPTPVGNLDNQPLRSKNSESIALIDSLGRKRAEPKADLNNDGVRTGANEAKTWIGGIVGKTVTVTFRAIYQGFRDRLGLDGGYTGGRFSSEGNFARYATGGKHRGYRLPKTGPGTEITDGFLAFDKNNVPAARLDAGEWVINSRSSEKYSKELAQINRGTFPKLPGYVEGGRHLRHAAEIDKFARGLEGKPYVWGGVNWGDCSGAMSAIARFAVGLAPFAGRFATGNQRAALTQMGFRNGRGGPGDLRFGWFNGGPYGGHTAGTLPNGVNVEMGGGRGNGQYGGPAAGANDPQFTDHAYLRVPGGWKVGSVDGADIFNAPKSKTYGTAGDSSTGANVTGGGYSSGETGPQSWSDVAATAASAWAKGQVSDILNVFGIPDSPPALQAYRQYQEAMKKDAGRESSAPSDSVQQSPGQKPPNLDWPENVTRTFKVKYDPGKGVEQWDSTVRMALNRTKFDLSNVRRTLDQIRIESNGDPKARNDWDINAKNGDPSVGLLQVIGSTFRAYRDKSLPNDQTHPLANVVAALNYVRARYGGPEKIWPTRAGYKDGGLVRGPGGKRGDKIPAWLSDMEYVINAAAAAKNSGVLDLVNGGVPVESMVATAMDAARDLAVAADGDVLSQLLGEERALSASRAAAVFSDGQRGRGGSIAGEGSTHNVTFMAANPEEMYRMYRRESARWSGGKVGAR